MSLYKRNGIYWYDFTWKGQRFRKSTGQSDKYLAGLVQNDKLSQVREQGAQSLLREAPLLKDFSVEFLKWVKDSHSIEPETRKYYEVGWRLISNTPLAEKRMDEITNHLCETITFPGSGAYANRALRTLRRMFTKAKELKLFFGELPEIHLRKEWPRSIAMTQADAALIASHMKGDPKDVLLILRGTGMRPKECFAMRWEYVNWNESAYQNPRGKTATARRSVPLLGESLEIMRRRHLEQGSPAEGWVFPATSESGHITKIDWAFNAAREKAGLPKGMVLYCARHGQMTDLAKFLTLKELMQVGGHASTSTALGYQHPTTDDILARMKAKGGVQ